MPEEETNNKIIEQIENSWEYLITGVGAMTTLSTLLSAQVGEPIPEDAVPGLSYIMEMIEEKLNTGRDILESVSMELKEGAAI